MEVLHRLVIYVRVIIGLIIGCTFFFIAGIPEWCVFNALLSLLLPYLSESSKVPKISLLIMFLMKIRLNLFDEDIGYRFGVHLSTLSRNFHRVLNVIACCQDRPLNQMVRHRYIVSHNANVIREIL